MRRTVSSTKPPAVQVSADTKDETFSSSAVQDLVQQKPAETDSNNYSLSAGAQLITTKKISTRHKTNEPVQHSFFERIEGSNYQTIDSTLQRGQLVSSGGKYDFQEFQVTASSEPTQATVEIACECESLRDKAPQDLSTQYVSAHTENQVEDKAESATAVALTPLPELSLIGSTPKASSEEIRSSETERPVCKVTDRDDALQWPARLDITERHSTRLGEAAALFDAPSDVVHTGHSGIKAQFSENKEMTEQVRQAEEQEGGHEEVSGRKIYDTAMQEGTAPAPVSEALKKPQIAPITYGAEQEERVSQPKNDQPRVDSSLLQYTPDEYILAELVREVEKKIEASSRYHVEPLPDDVITIRSSKGIESLGRLRYETYEEELLMRRSEDDLSQEQERSAAEAFEQPTTAVQQAVMALDQEGYAGVLEEYYERIEKRQPEPEPEEPTEAGAQPSVDIGEEVKAKVEEHKSAVTTKAQEKHRVLAEEHDQWEGKDAESIEVGGKEVFSEKSFDAIREERRRQFEQRWNDMPASIEREGRTASVQDKGTLEIAQRTTLTTDQGETKELQDKVFVKQHQGERTSENAVRRFIAAAIEEAAKREEATKSVKRFREYPCSEEAPARIRSGSPYTSATDIASRKEEERRLADIKVQQEKAMQQLVRCKSIAELIEQIIQQHVSGTDIHKQGIVHQKQVQAQDFTSAQAPGFPPNMGQQEIPVYYQTGTVSQKPGDQYVNNYRCSLQGAPRKSDTQLESTSHTDRRFSFSTLGGRGAKCVIRKLEPGALTYLIEVAPADKNQENQTDMVMAEEQMLVSEIFDHITTPNLRVSSSGTRLNEPAPITVSPAESLTAIRNAYAEAVAWRVLRKQSPQGTEGVLSDAQKAKFYDNRQGMNVEKTASSTSSQSAPSVEDYFVQRMLDSGIIRNQAEIWGKKPLNLENRVVSRTLSTGTFSKAGASSEAIAAPPPTPPRNVQHGANVEEGAEYCSGAAQDSTAQAPEKEEAPRDAAFEEARNVTAAASNLAGNEKQAMAATSAESYEEKRQSTFASSERSTRESQGTATVKATTTSEEQRFEAEQPFAASLKRTLSISSWECTLCRNGISPEKSFESFICFGLHDLPNYFAAVPSEVSDTVKLRIATDDDVREIMHLPWKEPESTYTLHAPIVTRHMLCPSSFFVAVDTSRGLICGAASVLVFDEEVAFCGFCHIRENYAFEPVGVLLWNELLHVASGKNLFTLLPEPACRELQEVYPFPSNPATGILFGPTRISRDAFPRTVLVLEYKDKYFDALASYDKHVFGFSRKRYLASTVHEVGLDIRVATRNERNICGFGGMQRDSAGRLVLRWLFADDAETAESLLSSLLASCSHEDEVEVVAAFFLRSAATRPILDKLSSRQLEPWRLVYTKREPLHSYGRVVCLTTV
ncbi:uncharacterized protein LOC142572709 [Dermacentor variabilis]|uniref:uncharacterized protein LOC142572709 n=1 Tax=Dermacentor variabilis TaxID=34621 RepID=UPI003F5C5F86